MSDIKDFVIENGVLKKYSGNDTDVVIPSSVKSIGKFAFNHCSRLTTVTIPDSVTNICYSAFRGCKNLTTISLSNGIVDIDKTFFFSVRI